MKQTIVKLLPGTPSSAADVPALLDAAGVSFQAIGTVDWPADYPYAPCAEFRLAATPDAFLLHYRVQEETVRALAGADNGPVWEDSCVEFFCSPVSDGTYYNVECNCAGTLLIGCGTGRSGRQPAPQPVLDTVLRWASLGRRPFGERPADGLWQVALVLPYGAFFRHRVEPPVAGGTWRGSCYNCGGQLRTPHFLSWSPIDLPKPDFHCPQFFGELAFEQ